MKITARIEAHMSSADAPAEPSAPAMPTVGAPEAERLNTLQMSIDMLSAPFCLYGYLRHLLLPEPTARRTP